MSIVTTSHGGRTRAETADTSPQRNRETARFGDRCQYSTAAGSLLATLLVLSMTYPSLRVLLAPLRPLSSTAIVTVAITTWATTWLALELVWSCEAG